MSKKSRKRNKKILAAIGLGLGAMALSKRKKANANVEMGLPTSDMSNYENEGSLVPAKKKTTTTTVTTPTTVMDSMPKRQKRNEKSTFIEPDGSISKGNVPTGKKVGIDTPGIFVNKKGNITAGGKQFYDKNQYKTRNDKPGMLGDSGFTRKKSVMANSGINRMSDDVAFKSGGRVKGCGKALRGFGKAMKGKR